MFDLIENEKSVFVVDDKPVTRRRRLVEFLLPKFACDQVDSMASAFDEIRENDYAVIVFGLSLANDVGEAIITQIKATAPHSITGSLFVPGGRRRVGLFAATVRDGALKVSHSGKKKRRERILTRFAPLFYLRGRMKSTGGANFRGIM